MGYDLTETEVAIDDLRVHINEEDVKGGLLVSILLHGNIPISK